MTLRAAYTKLQSLIRNPSNAVGDSLIAAMITLTPLFFMTMRGWTNTWLVIGFILAVIFLPQNFRYLLGHLKYKQTLLIFIAFLSPVFAILCSQILRHDLIFKAFDGPMRAFLAGFVFLLFIVKRINFLAVLQFIAPLSLLICVAAIHLFPHTSAFWGGRFATYFADPLTFGDYSLIIGFVSILTLNNNGNVNSDATPLKLLKLTGLLAGIYLSLGSMSRSGWLAIPFLIALTCYKFRDNRSIITKGLFSLLLLFVIVYFFNADIQARFQSIFTEVFGWLEKKEHYDSTSGGIRLSMWVVASHLFAMNPLAGYGDLGYREALMNHPAITSLASDIARESMYNGPHNEFLANMLRSGIFGFIATALLFFAPVLTVLTTPNKNTVQLQLTYIIIALSIGLLICSMMLEVFNLKYTISFYSFMIAAIMGQFLSEKNAF